LIFINFTAPALDTAGGSAAEDALGLKNKKETVLKIRQSPKKIEIMIDFFIRPPFPLVVLYPLPFANSLILLHWRSKILKK